MKNFFLMMLVSILWNTAFSQGIGGRGSRFDIKGDIVDKIKLENAYLSIIYNGWQFQNIQHPNEVLPLQSIGQLAQDELYKAGINVSHTAIFFSNVDIQVGTNIFIPSKKLLDSLECGVIINLVIIPQFFKDYSTGYDFIIAGSKASDSETIGTSSYFSYANVYLPISAEDLNKGKTNKAEKIDFKDALSSFIDKVGSELWKDSEKPTRAASAVSLTTLYPEMKKIEQLKNDKDRMFFYVAGTRTEFSKSQLMELRKTNPKMAGQLEKANKVNAKQPNPLEDAIKSTKIANIKVVNVGSGNISLTEEQQRKEKWILEEFLIVNGSKIITHIGGNFQGTSYPEYQYYFTYEKRALARNIETNECFILEGSKTSIYDMLDLLK